jgi:hypothetical protein
MSLPPLRSDQRWFRIAWLVAVALAGGFLLLKSQGVPLPAPPCAFKRITGLPCVFCGGTRAACAALGGDVPRALYLNPLSLPMLVGVFAIVAVSLLEILQGRPLADWARLFGLLRNVLPLVILLLLVWWVPHLVSVLKTPKPELIDLGNPVAATLRSWIIRQP